MPFYMIRLHGYDFKLSNNDESEQFAARGFYWNTAVKAKDEGEALENARTKLQKRLRNTPLSRSGSYSCQTDQIRRMSAFDYLKWKSQGIIFYENDNQ